MHRRRENKFHAPKNRKQAGADRGNTFFPSAIPLAATRPVQPGVVKYKLPDRLGQTRSDNRSLAREGREPATLNFQRIFHPPLRVHGGGKLSAVFQTRSTSPFPSTLALLLLLFLLLLFLFFVCLATRERANILPRRASRHHARRPLVRGRRRKRRRGWRRRKRRCTCIPWDWERTSLSARSFINIYPRLNPSGSSFSVSLSLSMMASSLSRFFFVSVSGSPQKRSWYALLDAMQEVFDSETFACLSS